MFLWFTSEHKVNTDITNDLRHVKHVRHVREWAGSDIRNWMRFCVVDEWPPLYEEAVWLTYLCVWGCRRTGCIPMSTDFSTTFTMLGPPALKIPSQVAGTHGLLITGLPITGPPVPGLPITGLPVPGLPITGLPVPGLPITGPPVPGLPITGLPVPGLPITGLPVPGLPITRLPVPGLPITGLPVLGLLITVLCVLMKSLVLKHYKSICNLPPQNQSDVTWHSLSLSGKNSGL